MEWKFNRRRFLKQLAGAGALSAGTAGAGIALHDERKAFRTPQPEISKVPDYRVPAVKTAPALAVAHGPSPGQNTRAVVDALGGMGVFIKPGDHVVIKPNVGWDRVPMQAANTNPEVVAEVVRMCVEAKAGAVTVTDVPCNDATRCFDRSGIREAAQKAGARVILPSDREFGAAAIQGVILKDWPVHRPFLTADKVINVAIVKHHNLCRATLAMKNWYGILGGRRNRLHQNIHGSIADLAQLMVPTLTVLDATRVLMRNGPTGGALADVRAENAVMAGTDQVAVDAYAVRWLDAEPTEIGYIVQAAERGLGRMDLDSLVIKEMQLG